MPDLPAAKATIFSPVVNPSGETMLFWAIYTGLEVMKGLAATNRLRAKLEKRRKGGVKFRVENVPLPQ